MIPRWRGFILDMDVNPASLRPSVLNVSSPKHARRPAFLLAVVERPRREPVQPSLGGYSWVSVCLFMPSSSFKTYPRIQTQFNSVLGLSLTDTCRRPSIVSIPGVRFVPPFEFRVSSLLSIVKHDSVQRGSARRIDSQTKKQKTSRTLRVGRAMHVKVSKACRPARKG